MDHSSFRLILKSHNLNYQYSFQMYLVNFRNDMSYITNFLSHVAVLNVHFALLNLRNGYVALSILGSRAIGVCVSVCVGGGVWGEGNP